VIGLKKLVSYELTVGAQEWDLSLPLLRAIVWVESAGNPYAMRYEPHYRWLYNVREGEPVVVRPEDAPGPAGFGGPGVVSKYTEYVGQKTSWGLMQVMGAVAREYGFRGFFPALCEPYWGINMGCKHLHKLKSRWRLKDNQLVELATAYNTGQPQTEDHPYWIKIQHTMEKDAE
jgi:soluble lytic murein transglycosylase-like protein